MIWKTKKLCEICDIQSGLWKGKKEPFTETYVLRNTNFTSSGTFNYSDVAVLQVETKQLKNRLVLPNDIILEKSGGGETTPVGRVCLYTSELDKPVSCSNFTARLRVLDDKEITPLFLHRFLYFLYKSKKTEPMQRYSTGIRNLQISQYKDIDVPLPPLEEQKLIVDRIDSTFKEIDNSENLLKERSKNLSNLFNSYIEEKLMNLKNDFPTVPMEEVIHGVQYGTSKKCSRKGQVPVLRMGNMQGGKFDLDDLVYLDDQIESEKYQVSKFDVFFNRTNSSLHVGKTAIWEEERKALFAGYLIRINYDKSKIDPYFLNYFLNSASTRKYGYNVMTESINQANINGSKLKQYPFIKADLYTQKILSKKFSDLEKKLFYAISLTKKSLKLHSKLRNKILLKEFEKKDL